MADEQDGYAKNAEGVRLLQSGDFEGAVKLLTEAISLIPDYATVYRNRAEAYKKLNRDQEAEADSEKVMALDEAVRERERAKHPTGFRAVVQWILRLVKMT